MCHSPLGSNLYPPDLVGGNVSVFWITPDPLFAATNFSRPIKHRLTNPQKNNDLKEAARIMGTELYIRGGRRYVEGKPNGHRVPCCVSGSLILTRIATHGIRCYSSFE